ncbi:unnamed protein product [Clonostachys solani]|uniref:25-hydroxycholesterol 7-alpha-hydroxylase n=1 Tax=Clonostachys solani TaxID=160281 RepID=A0A9N9YVA9_9HYPO|nr:unnamed protein product [Clonostachys solani]
MASHQVSQQLSEVAEALIAKVQEPRTATVLITVLVILLTTRLLSGKSESGPDDARRPPRQGYWVPLLGHVPQLALRVNGFLASVRNKYPKGAFSLSVLWQTHTVIYRPSWVATLMSQPQSVASDAWAQENLMRSNFGLKSRHTEIYRKVLPELNAQFKYILSDSSLSEATKIASINLKNRIAELVTFNPFPADQSDWERLSGSDVLEGASGKIYADLDLLELVRNFVAQTANSGLFGSDFVDNFQDFATLLWEYDRGVPKLAMKLSWWYPDSTLYRAMIARRRLLTYLREFHRELDKYFEGHEPGLEWSDINNVGTLIKQRAMVFRKHNVPIEVRASCDLALLWAMNARTSTLVFWMVYEISQDPILLAQIHEEITPHVDAVHPKNEFGPGVWLAPEIKTLDVEALVQNCPLLNAAYIETMRVYSCAWSVKYMEQDLVLKEKDSGDNCMLLKGTYAHVPHDTHHNDPRYFESPKEWQAKRHLKESVDTKGAKSVSVDMRSIRPHEGQLVISEGGPFAVRELLMFTSAIISMYEFHPVGEEGPWKTVKTVNQGPTKMPASKCKVWVRRRKLRREK